MASPDAEGRRTLAPAAFPSEFESDADVVVDRADSASARHRIRCEVLGRAWAASHAIPTAETVAVAADASWMVSRRVVDQPGESLEFVRQALATAARIEPLTAPVFEGQARDWRAPRRTAPVRLGRMVAAGIEPRAFVKARRAVEALPQDATVHHDYHRGNVLWTPATAGGVTVIDWELLGGGPRFHDAVRLIVEIVDPAIAYEAWDGVVAKAAPGDRSGLAAQLRWLALRTLASAVTAPADDRDAEELARLRERCRVAVDWSAEAAPPA